MKGCKGIMAALAIFVWFPSAAFAQVPQMINYQGQIIDTLGNPVPDSTYNIVFAIYGSPDDIAPLWSSGTQAVEVSAGLFSYQLGSAVQLPNTLFSADTIRYLGIKVGDDPEIVPRTRLITVPYAYHALRADTAEISIRQNGWIDDGTVVRLETESDSIGIGTAAPSTKVHIVGASIPPDPLLYIDQIGDGRGLTVNTLPNGFCAFVSESGNHGLRVVEAGRPGNEGANGLLIMHAWNDGVRIDSADNNGIYVDRAGAWSGYFRGPGYFGGKLGIGVEDTVEMLTVAGDICLAEPLFTVIDKPVAIYVNKAQGENAPGHDLEIYAGEYSDAGAAESKPGGDLILHGGTGYGMAPGGHVYIYGGSDMSSVPTGNIILAHDGTSASGKVGIGTADPLFTLEVSGPVMLENSSIQVPPQGHAGIYAYSGELFAVDDEGNSTQLSPHDPETGEWIFYSKNIKTGRVIRVDMERLVRKVEEITGEKFIVEEWEQKR